MFNLKVQEHLGTLTITIENWREVDGKRSGTGKSLVLASTEGAVEVDAGSAAYLEVNLYQRRES